MVKLRRCTVLFVALSVLLISAITPLFSAKSVKPPDTTTGVTEGDTAFRAIPDAYSLIMAFYDNRTVSESDLEKLAYEYGIAYTGKSDIYGVCYFDLIYETNLGDAENIIAFCELLNDDIRIKNAFVNPYYRMRTEMELNSSDSDISEPSLIPLFGTDETPSLEVVKTTFKESAERKYINKNSVPVYLLPTTSSPQLHTLNGNNIVYALAVNDVWSYVLYDDTLCYIENTYLSSRLVPGYNFKFIGNYSDERIEYAYKYLSYIPDSVWTAFQKKGWTLIITTRDIRRTYAPNHSVQGSFAGITSYDRKFCAVGDSEKRLRRALNHEIGHFADYYKGRLSKSSEFYKIYRAERSKVEFMERFDNHCTTSPTEYFAEAYSHYLIYPDVLKSSAPLTYEYMKDFIENF